MGYPKENVVDAELTTERLREAQRRLREIGVDTPISILCYAASAHGSLYTKELTEHGAPKLNFETILGAILFNHMDVLSKTKLGELFAVCRLIVSAMDEYFSSGKNSYEFPDDLMKYPPKEADQEKQ